MHDLSGYTTIESATAPVFSMDGRTLFHLRGAGQAQVWALDLVTRAEWQLTGHDERVSLVRRAPGDDRLVYAIDAGGDERHQLWLWEDGVSRALTAAPAVIHGFGGWSPDGTRISLTANDRDEAHFDVVVMEVASGARERVMEGVHEAVVGAPSKDGRMIVTQDWRTGDQRPFIVDRAGGVVAVPRRGATRFSALRWDAGEDGNGLLGLTDAGGREFVALCRVDVGTGGEAVEFAPEGRDVEAWSLSSTGVLATVENDRGFSVLRVGARGGERAIVELPAGVVADLAWSGDGGRLAFSLTTPTMPAGLWVWEGGAARAVWAAACDVAVRDFRLVSWESLEGEMVPGWMAVPEGKAPDAGWPAVVWVHGGPAGQTRGNFRADMQALLAQGYAVLMPNVRGSTGYGRAYMDADDVELRLDAVHDLAAGRNWLARQEGIDGSRIAVMGQSYGGYMVLAALTEYPALWRCGIDLYGISDFAALLEATGPWRRGHRAAEYGDPVRHRAVFDRISPIRHVGRIRVPLLVLHGRRDPRVAFGESERLVTAMGTLGREVTFETFDYAGHGFVRAEDKVRVYRAVQEFLAAAL